MLSAGAASCANAAPGASREQTIVIKAQFFTETSTGSSSVLGWASVAARLPD